MKYHANAIENGEAPPGYFAEVRGDPEVPHAIALRQARAMKAVLLAARAWAKAYESTSAKVKLDGLYAADKRLLDAQQRLEQIEKEVTRG